MIDGKIMFGKIFITQLRNCVMLVTPLITQNTGNVITVLVTEDSWIRFRKFLCSIIVNFVVLRIC